MKRWAFLVAGLYGLLLCALTLPLILVAFEPSHLGAKDLHGVVVRFGYLFLESGYWGVIAMLVLSQLALLAVPVRVASRRPVTQGALWPTVLAAGLMAGLLLVGAFISIDEFLTQGTEGSRISELGLAVGLLTWIVWAVVFRRMLRTRSPADAVTRQCRLLIQGSVLELLIAVPTHIVARHRDYCCAGFMTFLGLATGLAVMLFAFGPALYYLFAERWRRLHPERGATP